MIIQELLKKLKWEIVYILVSGIFLFFLWKLNHTLIKLQNTINAFELLSYKNGLPLKFFAFTLILITIGVFLIVFDINKIRYNRLEFNEILILISSIFLKTIIILILIISINNPILKAIASAICITIGGVYIISH